MNNHWHRNARRLGIGWVLVVFVLMSGGCHCVPCCSAGGCPKTVSCVGPDAGYTDTTWSSMEPVDSGHPTLIEQVTPAEIYYEP